VIRVDTDEFLLPDPAYYKDLREFSDRRTAEVVNARGFDVFQKIGEPDLDFTKPILCVQRKTAFAITSLNKPSITSKLVRWNRGFHYCSETPRFDNLFLFHVKRADIRAQQLWNEFMAKNAKDDDVRAYYQTSDENIEKFHRDMSSREIVRGDRILYREDFNSDFLRTIKLWKSDGIYHGKHAAEAVNVEIPQHFSGYF
jgi:hypothetical protein